MWGVTALIQLWQTTSPPRYNKLQFWQTKIALLHISIALFMFSFIAKALPNAERTQALSTLTRLSIFPQQQQHLF